MYSKKIDENRGLALANNLILRHGLSWIIGFYLTKETQLVHAGNRLLQTTTNQKYYFAFGDPRRLIR
jgi:hypothetical protein